MFLPILSLLPQQKWLCCQTLTCGPRLNKACLAAWRLPYHTLTAMETVQRLWLNRTHPIPIGYNYNHLCHLRLGGCVCEHEVRVYLRPLSGICRRSSRVPKFRIERSLFDTRWSAAVIWFLTVTIFSLFSPSFSWCNFTSFRNMFVFTTSRTQQEGYHFGLYFLFRVCVDHAICIY